MTTGTLVLLLWLLPHSSVSEVGSFSRCPQFFFGGSPPTLLLDPEDPRRYEQICQCRLDQNQRSVQYYATLYDTGSKVPVYSAYLLQQAQVDRDDPWYVEPQLDGDPDMCMSPLSSIPVPDRGQRQALNTDYEGSGYDKGHLYPVYHTHNRDTMLATSTLTNAAPQDPGFNRGQWKKHELDVVTLVQGRNCAMVHSVAGVVPTDRLVNNRVRVAGYYWRALCCSGGGDARASWGFLGPDNNGRVQNGTVAWLEDRLSGHYGSAFTIFHGAC